ncbi:Uncharacterised protein [Raoultella ornithinolytica]|nr:Uncharacterised protein [Raoultella ornithinolytica]
MQSKGHQPRTGRQHLETKLLGKFIAERRCPQSGHRQAAGGDHQFFRRHLVAIKLQSVAFIVAFYADNFATQANLHAALVTFRQQQVDDLLCGIITKQLAEGLLMPGNTVFAHQFDKIPLGITRQRRFAKNAGSG